jgi:hypothetical protein
VAGRSPSEAPVGPPHRGQCPRELGGDLSGGRHRREGGIGEHGSDRAGDAPGPSASGTSCRAAPAAAACSACTKRSALWVQQLRHPRDQRVRGPLLPCTRTGMTSSRVLVVCLPTRGAAVVVGARRTERLDSLARESGPAAVARRRWPSTSPSAPPASAGAVSAPVRGVR